MLCWLLFGLGLIAGATLAWLWMRARLAELHGWRSATEETSSQLQHTFESLAGAALRSNQTAFLEAARSTLETVRAEMTGDLIGKQTAIESVVQPLNENLGRLEQHIRMLEGERQKIFGSLSEQMQWLAKETVTLSTALRSPQTRGRWGEMTLRRVAELAGMVPNCDFLEQESRDGANGRVRPDLLVQLPGGRLIAVDAKVPLTAYLEACGAKEEAARKAAVARHGQQVAEHARQLGAKQYWSQFQPAPELVVLFLPGDHFLAAALEHNPALTEEALERKVVLATPVSLIAILKGIAYGWKQEQLAQNAGKLRSVAEEFYARAQSVSEAYANTGKQLEKTVEAYNRSVGAWDSRLIPSLRKMRELGIGSDDPAEPAALEIMPRRPRAAGE